MIIFDKLTSKFDDNSRSLKEFCKPQIYVECDNNLYAQLNTWTKELDEKTDAMQDLESLNCVLTVKECITNQELQESCKELMEVCLYPLIIIHAVERKIASSKYACSTKSV